MADMRQTNTHPSKKGADQETNFIENKWPDSDTKDNMTKSSLSRTTLRRGEDEIAKIVTPM